MKYRVLALLAVAILLAIPAASGSEGKIILSPNTHSAMIFENYSSSMEFSGSSSLISLLEGSLSNISQTASIKSTSSMYANLSGAIKNNVSSASVSDLEFSLVGTKQVAAGSLYYNISMQFSYSITGIFNSGTWNLSWRSASFHADIGSYMKTSVLSAYGASTVYVDMKNMSLPLTEWNRTYNPATNVTTFSHSTHFATLAPVTVDGITVNFTFDPSYSIVAPGNAAAGTDTISTGAVPPAAAPFNSTLIAVAVVVVAAAGIAVFALSRRSKK